MLKLGRLPRAAEPRRPTPAERARLIERIAAFQRIFDEH
jgi:hypothetical protein